MESTCGDRLHRSFADSTEELYEAISSAFARGGNVIIPTFALERAQEILYVLHQGVERSRLPPAAQVFLDSPMAILATEIFQRHSECLDPDTVRMFRQGADPLHVDNLHLARETADSIAINRITGGAIIMAGSGMCTRGRIRHHLTAKPVAKRISDHLRRLCRIGHTRTANHRWSPLCAAVR